MEKDWVSVFSTSEPYKADIAKQLLEENEIQSVVINKKDSSYLTFGETEVYVRRINALRAKNLLKELDSE
jgi:hypothetical protein